MTHLGYWMKISCGSQLVFFFLSFVCSMVSLNLPVSREISPVHHFRIFFGHVLGVVDHVRICHSIIYAIATFSTGIFFCDFGIID